MSQLIPVVPGVLAGEPVPTVNARELHQFLEVGRDFSNWIKGRIEQYGFEEGVDFVAFAENGERKNQWFSSFRQRIDYHLSLDMAKELAMVENNAKGREARRYFIRCERELKAQATPALRADLDRLERLRVFVLAERPDWAKVIRYRGLGLSQREIGRLMGWPRTTVRDALRRLEQGGLLDAAAHPTPTPAQARLPLEG